MRSVCLALGAACVLGWLPSAQAADAKAHQPRVPGFERFHAAQPTMPAGGLLLLGELNCTSCHAADASWDALLKKKQAPILDKIGARARPEWIRAFLANPHATKPGTTMPHVLAGVPEAERAAAAEALVHYLAATGSPAQQIVDNKYANSGKNLFHQVGCLACHESPDKPAGLATSVPLGVLAEKYTVPSLIEFLKDPLKVRPSGRMPGMVFKDEEVRDVAHYLLRGAQVQLATNAKYAYFEGGWEKLPDFTTMKPKAEGEAGGFDLGVSKSENNSGLLFTSYFKAPKDGSYTFSTMSDDGSKLWIDGKLVVDNDGTHPPQEKKGKTDLTAGVHEVQVAVFNGGGGYELEVSIEGGGIKQQRLDPLLTLNKDGSPMKRDPNTPGAFVLDADLATKGRELFASLGCASCHQMTEGGKPIASKVTGGPLAGLKAQGGCLSAAPVKGLPNYGLSAAQQTALVAGLAVVGKPLSAPPSAKDQVAHTLTTLNCYACHVHDKIGGPEEARNDFFAGNQKEMGDEGRVPPPLDGVGAKLTADWMKQLFNSGTKDRMYMFTRMPKFGSTAAHLVTAFEAIAPPVAALPEIKYDEPVRTVKASARMMVGDKAFGCIKCHNFNNIPATGIQSMDMVTMTKRLKHDWFYHYLLNPQAFRPGTRMPGAWPGGKSQLPGVLGGDAGKQVESIWLYLADGGAAPVPEGLAREPIVLFATKDAVIYRNFIEGAGPRAIGVGYPEKANLAYDANDMRLAMIWQGSFIDASKHWIGRGPGFQGPLGDHVVKLPGGPTLAQLASAEAEWPKEPAKQKGWQFKGYTVTPDQRPTFLSSFAGCEVEDFPNVIAGKPAPTIRRTLTVTGDAENLWHRAMVAGKIEPGPEGSFVIDGDWTIKVKSAGQPVIRQSAGKAELLVPVKLEGKKAAITVEYVW